MKERYKISEISKLYGIGTDSLRYYEELGILSPKRAENGYRLYGMKDIYRLNVIKDLRQFDFPMQKIKEYLDRKTVSATLDLLREEEALIEREIKKLNSQKKNVHSRILELDGHKNVVPDEIRLIHCDERRCVKLVTDSRSDEEIDFAFNRLNRKFDHRIYSIANYMMGATQNVSEIREGQGGVFRSVFFVLERGAKTFDSVIEAGDYLSLYYRGGYGQSAAKIKEVVDYAGRAGLRPSEELFELYWIDIHETNDTGEFLTEVQLHVGR